jgi:predicted amidohydrolase YtcJ
MHFFALTFAALALVACSASTDAASAETGGGPGSRGSSEGLLLRNARLPGGAAVELGLLDGRLVEPASLGEGTLSQDLGGAYVVPAFIDSHVHLAYLPEVSAMADGGVAGAVDMAAPIPFLATDHAPMRIKAAGPMITAVDGYPTEAWGRDGYGLECADGAAAVAGVQSLHSAGAALIKIPITNPPVLGEEEIAQATAEAHRLGLKVASHATSDEGTAMAARAGVDALAHTPTAEISDTTVALWAGKAVVSTLYAFRSSHAPGTLGRLRAAGATVLYGTDFGNTRRPGIDPDELALLMEAGLDGAAIIEAGTSAPAAWWGFEELGSLEAGKAASFLVLGGDPLADPLLLASPAQVWLDGVRR